MKHIFAVISPLTFCIAHKIVQLDGINPDDCVLFSLRDYHIPKEYESIYSHRIHSTYGGGVYEGRYFAGLNIFQTKRNVKKFDALIESHTQGDEYYWYTSSCTDDISNLMISNKKCVGYYVIEDGSGSYRNFNPQLFSGIKYYIYRFLLRPLFPRFYIAKNHFIETDCAKYKNCIATSQLCFPLQQENLRVIGNPFDKVDLGFVPEAVLSVDPLFYFISEDAIEDVYRNLAQFIKTKNYKTIAYKFHPIFNASKNKHIKDFFGNLINQYFGPNMIQLPHDIILEGVIINYKCDFYTTNSSTAIYSYTSGAKCYTYIPLLKKYTSNFDNIPLKEIFTEIPVPEQSK